MIKIKLQIDDVERLFYGEYHAIEDKLNNCATTEWVKYLKKHATNTTISSYNSPECQATVYMFQCELPLKHETYFKLKWRDTVDLQ